MNMSMHRRGHMTGRWPIAHETPELTRSHDAAFIRDYWRRRWFYRALVMWNLTRCYRWNALLSWFTVVFLHKAASLGKLCNKNKTKTSLHDPPSIVVLYLSFAHNQPLPHVWLIAGGRRLCQGVRSCSYMSSTSVHLFFFSHLHPPLSEYLTFTYIFNSPSHTFFEAVVHFFDQPFSPSLALRARKRELGMWFLQLWLSLTQWMWYWQRFNHSLGVSVNSFGWLICIAYP